MSAEGAAMLATFRPSPSVLDPPFPAVPHGEHLDLDNGQRAFIPTTGDPGDNAPILLLHGLGATGALNWGTCSRPPRRGPAISFAGTRTTCAPARSSSPSSRREGCRQTRLRRAGQLRESSQRNDTRHHAAARRSAAAWQ